jgi:hypothetical protein
MKNSNDTIGNRSRNLPVCSAVPQPLSNRVPLTSTTLNNISNFYPIVFFCLTFLSPLPSYFQTAHKKFKPIKNDSISVTMATALVQAAKKGLMSGLPAV